MGANQSSRQRQSPLGARKPASSGKSPISSLRAKGLSQSLRKSVGKALSDNHGGAKKRAASAATNGADSAPNGSLQAAAADSYYVSGGLAMSKPNGPSCAMNNYVTMQQQPSLATSTTTRELAVEQQQQRERGSSNSDNNNGFGAVVYRSEGASVSSSRPAALAADQLRAPMEMNSQAALGAGASFNGAQDHHHHQANTGGAFGPTTATTTTTRPIVVVGRSQQRQLQQQQQSSPFHFARAVNTKTSSVLNNSVAMPNGASAIATGAALVGRQATRGGANLQATPAEQLQAQHQQSISLAGSKHRSNSSGSSIGGSSSSSSSANSSSSRNIDFGGNKAPAAPVYPYHSSSQPYGGSSNNSPALANQENRPAQNGRHQLQDDEQHQSQMHQQQHQHQKPLNALQRRYKCPQQQYQYLNAGAAIDFHQATYRQRPQQQVQPRRPLTQLLAGVGGRQQQEAQLGEPPSAYSRSYSVGSSLAALNGKSKQRGLLSPLAALFNNQGGSQAGAPSRAKSQASTIHLARGTSRLEAGAASSASQRSAPGSLKRIKSAPLSAQHATYEAMRTIDMYLIRQIARSCMDFEMEQKIELEIRLRELAAQSMLEARNEIDVLEVEKSLLTSDQRMNCYASRLEQQRKQLALASNPSLSTDSGRGSKRGSHHHRQPRSDVIGATTPTAPTTVGAGNESTSSPSQFSSSSQSPSKLSPVSGESANSPSFGAGSSSIGGAGRRSRAGHARHNSLSANNTLSAKQRASNKRRELLMQSIASQSNINCNMVISNRASVSIGELRIPLMWRDVDHFKNRGDYKRFAVFCLLKIDSQIYDTQLITDVDRQVTDVTFNDLVAFNEVEHNFELVLEVYSCVYLEQFSLSSTPRKLKEKLTSSVSRAMGRRLATQTASVNYTKELQAYDKSYRFAMIASATLRLEDAHDSVKTYDLVLVSPSAHHRHHSQSGLHNSSASAGLYSATAAGTVSTTSTGKEASKNTLPLFGHFCCKLTVKPDVFDKSIKTGYLRVATINIPADTTKQTTPTTTAASDSGGSRGSPASNSITNGFDSTESAAKLRATLAASSKMAMSMSCSSVHWGLLCNFTLHLWPVDEQRLEAAVLQRGLEQLYRSEAPRTKPQISLSIDKFVRLLRVSNSSLTIETEKGCFVLGTYHPSESTGLVINQADEIGHWLRAIEQHIYDSHIWGSVLQHFPPHARKPPAITSSPNNNGTRRRASSSGKQYRDYYGAAAMQADF